MPRPKKTQSECQFSEVHQTPGAKANNNGKKFEKKVSLTNTFIKDDGFSIMEMGSKLPRTYLFKQTTDEHGEKINYYFFKQRLFQHYLIENHGYDKIQKIPDELVMIEKGDQRILKIIEIKWQQVDGSASEKIYGALTLKEIYSYLFKKIAKVELCYVLSPFLIEKYENDELFSEVVRPMLDANGIPYFREDQLEELKDFVTSYSFE